MKLDQLLHQRKADAAAFVTLALRAFNAVKPLKQIGQLLFGDADSGIADSQARLAPSPCKRTVTSPECVYLNALDRRLRTIFCHISGSA